MPALSHPLYKGARKYPSPMQFMQVRKGFLFPGGDCPPSRIWSRERGVASRERSSLIDKNLDSLHNKAGAIPFGKWGNNSYRAALPLRKITHDNHVIPALRKTGIHRSSGFVPFSPPDRVSDRFFDRYSDGVSDGFSDGFSDGVSEGVARISVSLSAPSATYRAHSETQSVVDCRSLYRHPLPAAQRGMERSTTAIPNLPRGLPRTVGAPCSVTFSVDGGLDSSDALAGHTETAVGADPARQAAVSGAGGLGVGAAFGKGGVGTGVERETTAVFTVELAGDSGQ